MHKVRPVLKNLIAGLPGSVENYKNIENCNFRTHATFIFETPDIEKNRTFY